MFLGHDIPLLGTAWSTFQYGGVELAPWLSLAAVSVALVFIFRKRWARSSVLTRCVVVSLYTHFTFGVIAYSTDLFSWRSQLPAHSPRQVRVRWSPSASPNLAKASAPESPAESMMPEMDAAVPAELALSISASNTDVVKRTTTSTKETADDRATPSPPVPSPSNELPRMPAPPTDTVLPQALASIEQVKAEVLPKYASSVEPMTKIETAPIETLPAPSAESPAKPETVVRRGDGRPLPAIYRKRFEEHRETTPSDQGGPTVDTETSVQLALAWLAAHQEEDGRWEPTLHEAGRDNPELGQNRDAAGADAVTGITSLALLAFMGAGETHLEGPYRQNIQRGLEFLLRSQRTDGGLAGQAKLFSAMYCHAMGTLALSEAMAITGDPRLKPFVERAVAYTVKAQHPGGGWRYQPGDVGDMSQFGWQVLSLESARLAGLEIPEQTRIGMQRFMGSVVSGKHRGLASYRRGERPSPTMTAEALVCRYLLESPPDAETLREGRAFVAQSPPARDRTNVYYWYYGTLAMRFHGGPEWKDWNVRLQRSLVESQCHGPKIEGSWDPDKVWGTYGGRVYQTALSAMCLEAYYRFDPAAKE